MPSYAKLGLILVASAALSASLIAILRPLLQRYVLAEPNARSSHSLPTPQGGGIAVVAATICVSAAAVLLSQTTTTSAFPYWAVMGATALIAVVGAIDDIRTIEVLPRLSLQAALVAFVVAILPSEPRIIDTLPWWLEKALLFAAGLWFVNLVNFMDGLDWMTVVGTVPAAAGLALAGLCGALPDYALITTTALAGAMLGFAPFNRPVARLFLGDVGSLPVGLLLGWLLALLIASGHLAAAILLPLYYLADATITLLRRIARGERPWEAHRTHFYQCATAGGFTVLQVVTRILVVNLALAALAMVTIVYPSREIDLASLATGTTMVAALLVVFARGRR